MMCKDNDQGDDLFPKEVFPDDIFPKDVFPSDVFPRENDEDVTGDPNSTSLPF